MFGEMDFIVHHCVTFTIIRLFGARRTDARSTNLPKRNRTIWNTVQGFN